VVFFLNFVPEENLHTQMLLATYILSSNEEHKNSKEDTKVVFRINIINAYHINEYLLVYYQHGNHSVCN